MARPSRNSAPEANDDTAALEGADASLVSGNIKIHGRRTSVRLEPQMWSALDEVASLEGVTTHDVCSVVDDCKMGGEFFSSALRVFLLQYYRGASRRRRKRPRQEAERRLRDLSAARLAEVLAEGE